MPQDWGPVVYSGSAITSTFPVDDTAICKQAPKPHVVIAQGEWCTAGAMPVPLPQRNVPECCPGHGQSGPVHLGCMEDSCSGVGSYFHQPAGGQKEMFEIAEFAHNNISDDTTLT